ncbi:MAG: N-methyl-D-aspartate receptor NMDAR2C subunit [Thalassobium sp.]|jgi:predicted metal-dependent HD superfamily phosphohydrolase|nr:MAG: N-methyl-D-aspartate receptor NMDAR2C subunit [Oceanospirillales bacterium]PHQ84984.1 MAG: N-methyl-D-aspartate receptor NMDAR2C subunit [Thalassobium sp.]
MTAYKRNTMLESSWQRCWGSLVSDSQAYGRGNSVMQLLIAAYNEPQRKYHTEQHLRECLSIFNDHRALAEEPAEIEMALWFHDAIYDIKATGGKNEDQSADWAVEELQKANVAPERVARIKDHILATKHSALPQGADQQLLVDIDLAILGAQPERFAEYEQQVRQEYRHVPGLIFNWKRKQILKAFLARSPIYATPQLKARFEQQARQNLAGAI